MNRQLNAEGKRKTWIWVGAMLIIVFALGLCIWRVQHSSDQNSMIRPISVGIHICSERQSEPSYSSIIDENGNTWYCDPKESFSLDDFDRDSAFVDRSPSDQYAVMLCLPPTDEDNNRLASWSGANLGETVGVFVDGQLVHVARMDRELRQCIVVRLCRTETDAKELMSRIKESSKDEH